MKIFLSFVVPPCQFLGDLQLSCGDLPKLYGASVVISWEPPIVLWRLPQALYGFSDCPQVSHSDRFSILVGGLADITVSLRAVWGALCLHTAPTEISNRKGVNFGIHHRLHVPWLFLYLSSFTYAIYFVISILIEVIYILLSHSCLSCLA
jgi:hypothetical protein